MSSHQQAIDLARRKFKAIIAERPSQNMSAGLSAKGAKTKVEILKATRDVFVEDGHAGLSLQKVAIRAGVGRGNLSYYFKSKQSLLHAMLQESLAEYVGEHLKLLDAFRHSPLDALLEIIVYHIRNAREEQAFFFQLWGYVAADEKVKAIVRRAYYSVGRLIYALVQAANPTLTQDAARRVVLQISSLEEGVRHLIGLGLEDEDGLLQAEHDMRDMTRRLVEAA